MRFRASAENLTVWVDPGERLACVSAILGQLVPKRTDRVYVCWEVEAPAPAAQDGMVLLESGTRPSNLLRHYRAIVTDTEIVVVARPGDALSKADWREFARELAGDA